MDNLLKAAKVKHADITKRIDGEVEAVASDPKGLIPYTQNDMPSEGLKELTNKYPLNEVLSTFLATRMMPKRADFQRLVLYSMNKHAEADKLYAEGFEFPVDTDTDPIIPADIDVSLMNPVLAKKLAAWIPEFGYTKPLVVQRMLKKAEQQSSQIQAGNEMSSSARLVNSPKVKIVEALLNKIGITDETPDILGRAASWIKSSEAKPLVYTNLSGEIVEKKAAIINNLDPELATDAEEAGKTITAPKQQTDSTKNPFFAITGLGALYLGFKKLMDLTGAASNVPKFERTLIQNPWLLPILAGGVGYGAVKAQDWWNRDKTAAYLPGRSFEPGMLKSILIATVPSYIYSGAQEAKVRRNEQIGQFQEFVRKHPLLTSLGALGVVRGGVKALNKYGSAEDVMSLLTLKQIEQIYNDIIS